MTDGRSPKAAKYYKPWILHHSVFGLLICAVILLLVLTYEAWQTLPPVRGGILIPQSASNANHASSTTTTATAVLSYDCAPGETCAPAPSNWLTVGSPTPRPSAPPPDKWLPVGVDATKPLSPGAYVLGAFVPTLVAILFAAPWAILDRRLKKLEAFYQMHKPGGASAADSLCLDYTRQAAPLSALKAIRHSHPVIALSALLATTSSLLVPLAPEAVRIGLVGSCSATKTGCIGYVGVNQIVALVVIIILSLLGVGAIVLWAGLLRRKTGVYAEPFSIAGMASLFHHPLVLAETEYLIRDQPLTEKKILAYTQHRKYRLGSYPTTSGFWKYGIIPHGGPPYYPTQLPNADKSVLQGWRPLPEISKIGKKRQFWLSSSLLAFILMAVLAIILWYRINTSQENSIEKLLNSQGFGVRFISTILGVLISQFWERLSRNMSQLLAYNMMSETAAPADRSMLISEPSNALSMTYSSTLRGNYVMAMVSTNCILSHVLTVSLSNVPFSNATWYRAYEACTYLSCILIVFMLFTLVFVFAHKQPTLPVPPSTIGAALCYLAGSQIPGAFSELAGLNQTTRNSHIIAMDLRYRFGHIRLGDGQGRTGIEVEPRSAH